MLENYLKRFPKARLNTKLFNELRGKAKFLVGKLDALEGSDLDGGKAMYYLSELQKVGSNWSDVVTDNEGVYTEILKATSFEEGGNKFGYPITTSINCPHCGLEPLSNAPSTRIKLSDYYCNKCSRFVIFSNPSYKPFRCKVRVMDDLIIVL